MIVELYGLPGSGKSTLAKKMAEEKKFEIVKIRNKQDLLFYNLVFFLKRPVKFLAGLFFVLINGGGRTMLYYKFMNCFLHYNAKYEKALRVDRAVLDQGHFQNILSVFEKPISERELLFYLRFAPRPDQLVIFNLPAEEVAKRISQRGYFGREEFDKLDRTGWQAAMNANHKLFLDNLNKIKNLNYKFEA